MTEVYHDSPSGYDLSVITRGLRRAKREGRIKNRNIGWFRGAAPNSNVYFYNRRAIAQLMDNPEQMRLLEPHGFSRRDTVAQTIAKLRRFYGEPFVAYKERPPEEIYRRNVIGGVFFGYSPREVDAFARLAAVRQQEAWRLEGKAVTGRKFSLRGLSVPRHPKPTEKIGARYARHALYSRFAYPLRTAPPSPFLA